MVSAVVKISLSPSISLCAHEVESSQFRLLTLKGQCKFRTSTPLHQMGFLECQIEHLRKIYTSLE